MSDFNNGGDGLEAGAEPGRPRYRPPIGLPVPRDNKAPSAIASVAIHVLLILLLVAPVIFAKVLTPEPPDGANGPGPAGGGGGGRRGNGGQSLVERLQYLRMSAPAPATASPPVLPVPQPVIAPPVEAKTPEAAAPAKPAPAAESAPLPGAGGGTGADGTSGSGPGTGGGVGSGAGTGTGSGVGAGTGGGDAEIFPPTLTQLALLPLPVPGRVRPYTMVASFDVDERGNARLIGFTHSKDGGYNRRIMDMLREIRFRPAVKRDGTPVRDTAVVTAIAP